MQTKTAMLTKEEVIEIVSYCKENKVTYDKRLKELGICNWSFYEAKKRYLKKEKEAPVSKGEFIQLGVNGAFVPSSITALEGDGGRTKFTSEIGELKIECQTSRGGMLRMSGKIPASMLAVLVQNL